MRKIIYRGQQRRYGEQVRLDGTPVPSNWFYGGVLQGDGDHSVIYDKDGKHSVYTDTLSEYTGFNDTNGSMIFEGDILKILFKLEDPMDPDREFAEESYLVYWNQNMGCWSGRLLTGNLDRVSWPSIGEMIDGHEESTWMTICVIGNRFDNPELIPEGLEVPDAR